MKKLFAAALLVVLCNSSYAQHDSTSLELGLNVIRLTNFLGFADNTTDYEEWNPYMFTAGYNTKRFHMRYGLGYNSIYRVEQPTNANGQSTFDTTSKVIDMRFGIGMQFNLSSKWTFKLGADYFVANRFTSFEAKFKDLNGNLIENVRNMDYKEKGFSPFLFVQYNVASRVSLGTELLWRMSSYTLSDSDLSNGNSAQINKEYAGSKRLIMAPTALFIQVRF
jgi:opacity protein-like surface antigen